jgi:hypothetical protein
MDLFIYQELYYHHLHFLMFMNLNYDIFFYIYYYHYFKKIFISIYYYYYHLFYYYLLLGNYLYSNLHAFVVGYLIIGKELFFAHEHF